MPSAKFQPGPTGRTVAGNVKRLREDQNLSTHKLASRLRKVGSAMTPTSVQRLEAGERRVDVDDMMYLSRVLDVTPLTLLLPPYLSPSETAELTAFGNGMTRDSWKWALGHHDPMVGYAADDDQPTRYPRSDSEFRAAVLPREVAELLDEIFAATDYADKLKAAGAEASAMESTRNAAIQRQILDLTHAVKEQKEQLNRIEERLGE